jgi:hypothetical protein
MVMKLIIPIFMIVFIIFGGLLLAGFDIFPVRGEIGTGYYNWDCEGVGPCSSTECTCKMIPAVIPLHTVMGERHASAQREQIYTGIEAGTIDECKLTIFYTGGECEMIGTPNIADPQFACSVGVPVTHPDHCNQKVAGKEIGNAHVDWYKFTAPPEPECLTDADCPDPNQVCDTINGVCVDAGVPPVQPCGDSDGNCIDDCTGDIIPGCSQKDYGVFQPFVDFLLWLLT